MKFETGEAISCSKPFPAENPGKSKAASTLACRTAASRTPVSHRWVQIRGPRPLDD